MTDLSTNHLQHLLAESSPGPWESLYGVAGVPEGWDEYWVILQMGRHRLPLRSPHYPLEDEEYANFDLAAAAPELAEEVIRLREELRDLRDHLKKKAEYHSKVELSTDPLDGIELEDNYAEDQISRILGDHDE